MPNQNHRTAIATATFAIVVIGLLVAGGLYVRSLISNSFTLSAGLAGARVLAYDALRFQLDEETGLRGYSATHDPVFLEPFHRAKPVLKPTIDQLIAALPGLGVPQAQPLASDLLWVNAHYSTEVADRFSSPAMDLATTRSIELLGKRRVDRFRSDVRQINTILTDRETVVDAQVRSSIDRIGLLVGGAVALVLLLSILYNTQQSALAARVELARERAAEERREADVMRSAYLVEKRIADTLQEAFVQRPLPSHPTFRFSATYVPASEEAKVGGDWYDALELPGNRVLFVIGDVTGHGIEAAVTMNRVRQTLISSALLDPSPAALLGRVANELYADKTPLVTAVAGFADSNTFEFVYATAGHPPPLLIEPGRAPRMLDCGSLPLGAMPDNDYRTFRIQSVPGATLVLYTDGAIEHSHDVIAGEEILLAAAAGAVRQSSAETATFIHNTVFNGRPIGDDVAILTIGFAAEPAFGVRISADRAGDSAFTGRLAMAPIAPRSPSAALSQAPWWMRQSGKKVA